MSKRIAVIDLGSNSVRMVIFERTSRLGFYIVGEYKIRVRLGEGSYEKGGVIQENAMIKCFTAFSEFKKIINRYKVRKILAVGTSALRDGSNASYFINKIRTLGINLRIICGELEAYYGGFAAARLLPDIKNATTLDIGGGSAELARIENGKVVETFSLNLGTVRLKELFYDKRDLSKMDKYINDIIKTIPESFKCENLISIGGSLRAISNAIMKIKNYPLEIVHGFTYDYNEYSEFIDSLSTSQTLNLNKFPIKKDRYDTIRGGAYIFKSIVKFLEAKKIITSGVGVREGVFLTNLIGNNAKFPANFNPSLKSLQDRFDIEIRPNLTRFAKEIYKVLSPIHNIKECYEKELVAASKLVNVGQKIGFYSKHINSSFVILNSLSYGFTHKEKTLIAAIIRLNGKKNIEDEFDDFKELLPSNEVVIWLSFILKLAYVLDTCDVGDVKFSYAHQTLQVYGLKDAIFVKDEVKKIPKPGIFAITFN